MIYPNIFLLIRSPNFSICMKNTSVLENIVLFLNSEKYALFLDKIDCLLVNVMIVVVVSEINHCLQHLHLNIFSCIYDFSTNAIEYIYWRSNSNNIKIKYIHINHAHT